MIILVLLTACLFAAFAKPFPPTSDAFASGDASDNLISANAVTLPAFPNNAGTADLLASPSRSFNLFDPSDSSTTPSNFFSSAISKITPNIQELGPQDVLQSKDTLATTLGNNVPSSDLVLSILKSGSNTLPGPTDSNLGSTQVEIPVSDPYSPAESGDSNQSDKIALEDGDVFPLFPEPIRKILDGAADWVGDWIHQLPETLQNWMGSNDPNIPDCEMGKFSYCCWKPAPTKLGNNNFDLKKLGDSRRDCWKRKYYTWFDLLILIERLKFYITP